MSTPDSDMCLCARISERLAEQVGPDRFERFFGGPSRLALSGDRLDIDVPNRFAADWIKRHFHGAIHNAVRGATGSDVDVRIRVMGQQEALHPAPPHAATPDAQPQPTRSNEPATRIARGAPPPRADQGRGDGRASASSDARRHPHAADWRSSDAPTGRQHRPEPRHTLDSFLVGESNRLAHEAARRFAESDNDFHVLFLHGPCGVGKTHLVRGLVRRRRELMPQQNLRYVTGEQFTNEFLAALKNRKLESFRAQLRRVDLLCIDDVHFLSNKQATQAELLHTLKMIDLTGAQLVLASDEHPQQIRKFAEHLTSRFLSGMVAGIETPDVELRQRLAVEFARRRRLTLSEPVVEALAHRFAASPRELHGAIMKLEVTQRVCGGVDGAGVSAATGVVGMAVYRRAFADSQGKPNRPVQAGKVLECICEHLQVDPSEVLGRSRHRRVVLARSLCAHLIRELTTLSYPEIAERMSRPNHSTIITACQRLKGQLERDERVSTAPGLPEISLRALAEDLKRRILRA